MQFDGFPIYKEWFARGALPQVETNLTVLYERNPRVQAKEPRGQSQ